MIVDLKLGDDKELKGNLVKKVNEKTSIGEYLDYAFHVDKLGKMVESAENYLRNKIGFVSFEKPKSVDN